MATIKEKQIELLEEFEDSRGQAVLEIVFENCLSDAFDVRAATIMVCSRLDRIITALAGEKDVPGG